MSLGRALKEEKKLFVKMEKIYFPRTPVASFPQPENEKDSFFHHDEILISPARPPYRTHLFRQYIVSLFSFTHSHHIQKSEQKENSKKMQKRLVIEAFDALCGN